MYSISDNIIYDEIVVAKDEKNKSDIERELESYRLELEAERKDETSSALEEDC